MVSFLVAVYNGAKYLEETINSALKQKDIEFEIIIIDDSSTDNSYEEAKKLERKNNRIKVFRNNSNLGFCRTVNKGVQKCKGEYISILDQDDLLPNYHCSRALRLFDEDTAVVFSDFYSIDSSGIVFDRSCHCLHRDITLHDLIFQNQVLAPGIIIKKKAFLDVGGYPENDLYKNFGEYHTWIRIIQKGKIKFCPETIAYYRRHDKNITNSFSDNATKEKLAAYFYDSHKQIVKFENVKFLDRILLRISLLRDRLSLYRLRWKNKS